MLESLNISIDEFTSPIDTCVSPETSIKDIFIKLKESGHRHMPIVKENKPVGLITHADLIKSHLDEKNDGVLAKDLLTSEPYCVPQGSSLDAVAFHMSTNKIESALVIDEHGGLDGIFTSVDALNALVEVIRGEAR